MKVPAPLVYIAQKCYRRESWNDQLSDLYHICWNHLKWYSLTIVILIAVPRYIKDEEFFWNRIIQGLSYLNRLIDLIEILINKLILVLAWETKNSECGSNDNQCKAMFFLHMLIGCQSTTILPNGPPVWNLAGCIVRIYTFFTNVPSVLENLISLRLLPYFIAVVLVCFILFL